jgi:hypothetical protein
MCFYLYKVMLDSQMYIDYRILHERRPGRSRVKDTDAAQCSIFKRGLCIIIVINNWEELLGYVQLVHSTFPEDIPQIGTIGFYMMEKAF